MKELDPIPIVQGAFTLSERTALAQTQAELRNAAKRQAERQAAYAAWSDPKAIEERRKKHEADAPAALERGKAMAAQAKADLQRAKEAAEMAGGFVTGVPREATYSKAIATEILERTKPWYKRIWRRICKR